MARGLDHIVHAVHDLDQACRLYQRLGFSVGARNRHPPSWGTENHIVQLPGFFIELLAIADPSGIVPHGPKWFSFGAFNRDFLDEREGLSMLVLESADAQADAAEFRADGVGDFEVFDFERAARRPDGVTVKVAFSLAFARDDGAPEIGFFSCQQHHPENFWNPEFQQHRNSAAGVAAAVLVADNPADHHVFIASFVGERALMATSAGIRIRTPRGEIQIMDPAAFSTHFGVEPPSVAAGARLAALKLTVGDFGAAVATLKEGNVKASVRMGRIIVPELAGMTMIFEPNPS
jgi:catechol 2,3-dioxygenase-like lactoylglutathione lyase family enzyme